MTTLNKAQSEDNCSNCVLYRKEIDGLKEAFIEADVQSVRQQTQLRDEISKSDEDCTYTDELLEDAKAEIKRLKAEHSSGSQRKKKALEKVGSPNSNATLRAPSSVKGEQIEH